MALLIIIYIGFIAAGIPHSLIGASWPAMYPQFEVSSEYVGYITLVISLGIVVTVFFSDSIVKLFGTAKTAIIATGLTAVAMLGISFAQHIWVIFVCAAPLGLGLGAIDASLNGYITKHYEAKYVNFLHCFYGIGIMCTPLLISSSLSGYDQWRVGYRYVALVQAVIMAILIGSLPLWKKKKEIEVDGETEETVGVELLPKSKVLKMSDVLFICLASFFINAIEGACTTWGSTFLVESKSWQADTAATTLSIYFIGITLGRFLSGVLSTKIFTWKRIYISIAFMAVSLILTFAFSSYLLLTIAFFLIGFGVGPIYPNLLCLVPHSFEENVAGAVTGPLIAFAYGSSMVVSVVFGWFQKWFGIGCYPFFLLALFALFAVLLLLTVKKLKSKNKYNLQA